jgi:guanylate kinase
MVFMAKIKLILLSAPSGSGKTTIAREILSRHPDMLFSVSATTRPIRSGETEGKDHFFMTKEDFLRRREAGGLVEWEELYGNYYGTLKSEIDRALSLGQTMLFDIDVKGALSIHRQFPGDTAMIFIKPPSFEVLKNRLEERRTENPEALKQRLDRVQMELEQGNAFDYQVVNEDLQKAIEEIESIIIRCTTERK